MARIVHVISSPRGMGGAERVLAALATAQRSEWHHMVVNVSGENPDLCASCAPIQVDAPPFRTGFLAGRRALINALSEIRPHLVHAHLPLAMLTLATIRRRHDTLRVATHHHGDHFRVSGRRMGGWADRFAGARFDVLVAPSETVRRSLIDSYNYSPEAVRTITNGWTGVPPAPEFGAAATEPTVVSVANFRSEKNHPLLVRAFAIVHEKIPSARLLLVGGGPGERTIRELVEDSGLQSSVTLAGSVDSVWPHLSRSHLFVLPSNYETFGIAVLEAMAAGLPVVATAAGGLPELVETGVNGELVEPGNHLAMADAIIRILGSEELRQSMGAAGRETAAQHTLAKMVDRYFSLYSELQSSAN